ncbi:MAG: heavy metal-responsive transcriptional regulator [Alphaproteobacteria bacterium]
MKALTVGDVARKTGVNVATLRYYERRGLIPRPARTASNYRIYTEDAARRVLFIKRAQALGFSLEEIKDLLSLKASPVARCGEVREIAAEKIRTIDDKVDALEAMRVALSKLIAECAGEGPVSDCPILESLEAGKPRDLH